MKNGSSLARRIQIERIAMPCEIWNALLEHCYEAETVYSQAITDSSGLVGVEFDKALQRAEEARKVSQDCEKALLHHERMHDCVRKLAVAKAS
jgi:hypothetical protein